MTYYRPALSGETAMARLLEADIQRLNEDVSLVRLVEAH